MNKKTRPKKSAQKDWTRAYIGYRLKEAGWTLSGLAKHHKYASRSTLQHALDRPWPKGEQLIAAAIGVAPETIWPTRYKGSTRGACNAPVTDLREAA